MGRTDRGGARAGGARVRPVRLKDVAAGAGVSVATASIVLNQPHALDQIGKACAARVRDVAQQLGYVPNFHAQAMRGRRTGVVGVALQFGRAVQNHLACGFFGTLVGGIDETLRQAGQCMLVINAMGPLSAPEHGLLALRRRQIDGLIVVGMTSEVAHSHTLEEMPPDLPVVVIQYAGATSLPVIGFDEAGAVETVVRHLAGLGHRELLWVGPGSSGTPAAPGGREHLFGDVVRDLGLRAAACRYRVDDQAPDVDAESAAAAAGALRAHLAGVAGRPPFSAVVCYNDLAAVGAYAALGDRGLRVPADISVTGFDDIQGRLLHPGLTTASHVLPEMGARAVALLMERVAHPELRAGQRGLREQVPSRLVVRASTAVSRSPAVRPLL